MGWLIEEFERDPMLDDQLSTRIYELTVPAIAEDLIRFIKDRRYGDKRWPLCLALAKTKHPQAADVIASILGQGVNTRGALEALAKLPAQLTLRRSKNICAIPMATSADRRRKTLAKLGVVVETPPPPVHVVKNRRSCPKGLEEWSANLDLDDLAPTLKTLAKNVDSGFSEAEIAEVVGVAEELAAEKTKTFRFPVKVNDRDERHLDRDFHGRHRFAGRDGVRRCGRDRDDGVTSASRVRRVCPVLAAARTQSPSVATPRRACGEWLTPRVRPKVSASRHANFGVRHAI